MPILNIGDCLQHNRYKIVEVISDDTGFGVTYKVIDYNLPNQPIRVIKQLKKPTYSELHIPQNIPKQEQEQRFQKIWTKYFDLFKEEAKTLGILGEKYDQIPQVFDFFTENDQHFYVQEYIEGTSLDHDIIQGKTLTEEQIISLLIEILEVLEYLQSNNEYQVIHRDIKPENIIRRKSDQKLVFIDFGLVKEIINQETQWASIIGGTPGYIAPEISLRKVCFASDIYSVGMIGIFAITGEDPRYTNNLGDEWQQKVKVSDSFADILNKMICHDYKERYQNAKEAKIALQNLFSQKQQQNQQTIPVTLSMQLPPSSSDPTKLILGLIISILVILGVVFLPRLFSNQLQFNGKENKGELTQSDRQELASNPPRYYDIYSFEGKQDQTVTLEVNSDDFKPDLKVIQTNVKVDKSVNQSSVNTLVITLPETGTYQVKITSIEGGKTGNYTIKAWLQ